MKEQSDGKRIKKLRKENGSHLLFLRTYNKTTKTISEDPIDEDNECQSEVTMSGHFHRAQQWHKRIAEDWDNLQFHIGNNGDHHGRNSGNCEFELHPGFQTQKGYREKSIKTPATQKCNKNP